MVSAPGGGSAWSEGVCSRGDGGLVSQHALRQSPPGERRLLLRTVRILLECIIVMQFFAHSLTFRGSALPVYLQTSVYSPFYHPLLAGA